MSSLSGSFSVGATLATIFRVYGRNWVVVSALSLLLIVLSLILSIAPTFGIFLENPGIEGYFRAAYLAETQYSGAMTLISIVSYAITIYVQTLATLIAFASITGPKDRLGTYLSATNRVYLPAVGLFLIFTIVLLAVGFAIYLLLGLARPDMNALMSRLGPTEITLLVVAFFALGLYLFSVFIAVFPALVIERPGVFRSITRGMALSRGNRWRLVAIFLILLVIGLGVVLVFSMIGAGLGGGGGAAFLVGLIFVAIAYIVGVGFSFVVSPAIYHHLKLAKDGPGAEDVGQVFD